MAKEDLNRLGFSEDGAYIRVDPSQKVSPNRREGAIIAGTGVKTSGKWGWN